MGSRSRVSHTLPHNFARSHHEILVPLENDDLEISAHFLQLQLRLPGS